MRGADGQITKIEMEILPNLRFNDGIEYDYIYVYTYILYLQISIEIHTDIQIVKINIIVILPFGPFSLEMITMLSYDMTMVRSGLAIDDICQSFVFSVDDNRRLYDTVGGVRPKYVIQY